jgi:superoxide dismutase, Fe-Mn family
MLEHAYYLQYQNVKGDWVTASWKVVDWEDVAQRFQNVRTLDLGLESFAVSQSHLGT